MDPKPGSVRRKDENGNWKVTEPGDPLYSMALFMAEDYFDGNEWFDANDIGEEL